MKHMIYAEVFDAIVAQDFQHFTRAAHLQPTRTNSAVTEAAVVKQVKERHRWWWWLQAYIYIYMGV